MCRYDEDDELLSEYAPSELSDLIAAEGKVVVTSSSESSETSYESEEEEIVLTAEQVVEKEMDEKNIIIEVEFTPLSVLRNVILICILICNL